MNTTRRISDNTPITSLTLGQLKEALGLLNSPAPAARYVYGLKGIQELFGVSQKTAYNLKNGILKDAVIQYGRTIRTDVAKAEEIMKQLKK